jgi:hypothetical protein
MTWESGDYNLPMIEEFSKRASKHFSIREEVFLKSITQQLEYKANLSWSQENWISKIMEKYSPSRIEEEARWTKNFNEDLRSQALQVARYYQANPPYFSDIVSRVLGDEKTFTLSLADWTKFCENKYSLKIRDIYKQEPKYKKAECVQIRANNKIELANYRDSTPNRQARRREANKVGFVLETNAKPVTRAAKGSRIYKILLSGETSPIYAHEADLKRKR